MTRDYCDFLPTIKNDKIFKNDKIIQNYKIIKNDKIINKYKGLNPLSNTKYRFSFLCRKLSCQVKVSMAARVIIIHSFWQYSGRKKRKKYWIDQEIPLTFRLMRSSKDFCLFSSSAISLNPVAFDEHFLIFLLPSLRGFRFRRDPPTGSEEETGRKIREIIWSWQETKIIPIITQDSSLLRSSTITKSRFSPIRGELNNKT